MALVISNKIKKFTTGIVIAGMLSTGLAAPANAGGSISLNIIPGNSRDANDLHSLLQLYSLIEGSGHGGSIRQRGRNNRAGVSQRGRNNRGIIFQDGSGHNANLRQYGNNNSYGLFQFGKNTRSHVTQRGYGRTGATIQYGW